VRVLIAVLIIGLAFTAPVAAAEETTPEPTTTSSSSTTTSTDTNSSGPEPTGCRPYCVS